VTGMDDAIDGADVLTTPNVVVADTEEIPAANQVIEDEDIDNVDEDNEDDDDDYEYEDDDYAAFSGFIVNNDNAIASSFLSHSDIVEDANDVLESITKPATIEEDLVTTDNYEPSTQSNVSSKPKWRQPSEEAVNMSLRAEKEKTGNKRRLALDLYRIMNQDTDKAGFTLVPKSEDCMDTWAIKLFQFDEDSKLAQDMKVLSVPCIELEMKFPDQYPFEPPFVRVAQPRFRRQTGFVMNGALCMELLTKVRIFILFNISIDKDVQLRIVLRFWILFSNCRMDGIRSMTLKA
jgi:ubiquitin-conjugating enzyme E2 Q